MSNHWSKPAFFRGTAAIRTGLALLWPRTCAVCGETCRTRPLCGPCLQELPGLPAEQCHCCGLPASGSARCGHCQRAPRHFDATLACYAYAGHVPALIVAMKSGRAFPVGDWLGAELAARAQDLVADLVVPMPLHPRRLAERGFNPALELCRSLSRRFKVDPQLVVRDVDTPHQAGLRLKARRRNVKGAFRCLERLDGLRVLVVDDVMTSGSTLDELARTLKLAGAASVTNLVVARTLARSR